MPTNQPVTAENMNYAIIILVAILVFAMIYWFAGGARKYYIGPRIKKQGQKEKDNIIVFFSSPNEQNQVTRF